MVLNQVLLPPTVFIQAPAPLLNDWGRTFSDGLTRPIFQPIKKEG
jgi:hypothetical protein